LGGSAFGAFLIPLLSKKQLGMAKVEEDLGVTAAGDELGTVAWGMSNGSLRRGCLGSHHVKLLYTDQLHPKA
jgi:hypothetical protein